jgi:hypothetical protein
MLHFAALALAAFMNALQLSVKFACEIETKAKKQQKQAEMNH